uniref:Odorant receptor n=1 Tax=Megaselia scalaris TaxID=36166 RepID=T1GPT3_MEGSC
MISKWIKKAIPASDKSKVIKFDDFFKRGLIMQKTCGSEPYVHNFHRATWKTVLLRLYYITLIGQLNILMFGEVVIVKMYITDPEYFLAATAMVPCILFIVGMDYKEYLLRSKEKDVYKVMDDLREIFPDTLEDQIKYNAHDFCVIMQKIELLFIFCCLSFTTVFSSMPIIVGLCRVFFTDDELFGRDLPYAVWYPYDVTKPLPFLCELVNNTYSNCILLSFGTASGAICFIGYNLTSSTISDAIKFGFFLSAEIAQIAAICFYGNTLLETSAAVGDAIYDHDWHNADLEYKKMLVEIIIRSQKEANIRAPTFPPTSYETFMGVMSTSYKFLTVLRQWLNR